MSSRWPPSQRITTTREIRSIGGYEGMRGEGSIYWAHQQQFSSIIGWCKISCRLKQKSFNYHPTHKYAGPQCHIVYCILRHCLRTIGLGRGQLRQWDILLARRCKRVLIQFFLDAEGLDYYCTKWGNWFPSKTKKSRSQLPSLCVFRFVLCNSCFDKSNINFFVYFEWKLDHCSDLR